MFAGRDWYLVLVNFQRKGHILTCRNKIKLLKKETSPKLIAEVNTCPRLEGILRYHLAFFLFYGAGRGFGTTATSREKTQFVLEKHLSESQSVLLS